MVNKGHSTLQVFLVCISPLPWPSPHATLACCKSYSGDGRWGFTCLLIPSLCSLVPALCVCLCWCAYVKSGPGILRLDQKGTLIGARQTGSACHVFRAMHWMFLESLFSEFPGLPDIAGASVYGSFWYVRQKMHHRQSGQNCQASTTAINAFQRLA